MKSRDQLLLEEAYQRVLLNENLVSEYSTDTHRKMDKFLTNVINGKNGYFTDDDLGQYSKLKSGLSNVKINDLKETIDILINYSYYSNVGFGSFGKVGKPAGQKVKTFVIDDKGVLSLTEVGSGKKTSTPTIKFQRDENLKPKGSGDFEDNLQVGDTREDIVTFDSAFETYAYGKKLIVNKFKVKDKNIKLTSFDKKNLNFQIGDEINLKYVVKKPNVYKGELSYVVDVMDIENISRTSRDKSSSDLKSETNEMIKHLNDKIKSRNQTQLSEKLIRLIMIYMNTSNVNELEDFKRQLIELDNESNQQTNTL